MSGRGRADSEAAGSGPAGGGEPEAAERLVESGERLAGRGEGAGEPARWERDAFFKESMGNPAVAGPFLQDQLPEALVRAVDWGTLELESGEFASALESNRAADLVFRVRGHGGDEAEEVYIQILLEHQTRAEDAMAYRILEYMVRIWERHVKERGFPLPLVYPLVLHQAACPWRKARSLSELVALPAGVGWEAMRTAEGTSLFPELGFHLVDLGAMDFGQLRERTLWAAFLSIMKLVEEPADGERIGEVLGLVEEALAGSNTELFGRLLEYLFRNARSVDRPRILKQFKNMKTEEHEVQGKTIAEHLIEEGLERGRERGRQEGMQAGQRAMLLRQIRRRFGDLPAWAEESVERACGSELEAMMDRLLEARSLAEVLGERER